MKNNLITRAISLIMALTLILCCFSACSEKPDTPHAVLSYDGVDYYYGMQIDKDALLEKYPNTKISANSYSISPEVSFILREVEGNTILAGYFINTFGTAKLDGIAAGASENQYLSNFENSSILSSDKESSNRILGFYYYNDKRISATKYNQYLNAARFEGTEAYENFLNTVIVSTAFSTGTNVTSLCYGDYNAIYNGR